MKFRPAWLDSCQLACAGYPTRGNRCFLRDRFRKYLLESPYDRQSKQMLFGNSFGIRTRWHDSLIKYFMFWSTQIEIHWISSTSSIGSDVELTESFVCFICLLPISLNRNGTFAIPSWALHNLSPFCLRQLHCSCCLINECLSKRNGLRGNCDMLARGLSRWKKCLTCMFCSAYILIFCIICLYAFHGLCIFLWFISEYDMVSL